MSNVKAGDLAVIVGSVLGNNGKVVLVLREHFPGVPIGSSYTDRHNQLWRNTGPAQLWEVEAAGTLIQKEGGRFFKVCPVPDSHLRPITPPPGTVTTDEVRELYSPNNTPEKQGEHA
jgi:hypothetical protein